MAFVDELLEVNVSLKEDIQNLEKMYVYMLEAYQGISSLPGYAKMALQTVDMLCTEQIKAQRGESTSFMKCGSVEEFANIITSILSVNVRWIEEKYKV